MFMPQVFNLALDVAGILRKVKILSSLSICFSLSGFNIRTPDTEIDLQNVRWWKMRVQSTSSHISRSCTVHLEKYFPVCSCVMYISTQRQSPLFLEIAIRTSISTVVVSLVFLSFQENMINERFKNHNACIFSLRPTLNKYWISRFEAQKRVNSWFWKPNDLLVALDGNMLPWYF